MYSTDLHTIQQLAAQRQDEFEVMCHQLEFLDDIDDAALDAIVDRIAAPIIAAIDCTQCANCCRVLDVYLLPEDAARLASGLHVPLSALLAAHVSHADAAQEGEWGRLRAKPCAFLRGSLCSLYDHRPDACRRYPQFTPDFRWTLADMLPGAALCPIICHVLCAVADQVDEVVKNL